MKIERSNTLDVRRTEATQQKATPEVAAGKTAMRAVADAVQLSKLSGSIRADAPESPERTAHLAAVTVSVQSGRYRVDPGLVSASIIEHSMRTAA
jgi:anti-sigma28 factor (negative regulator of flagellin synthesis)